MTRAYYTVDEVDGERAWLVCTSDGMDAAARLAREYAAKNGGPIAGSDRPLGGYVSVTETREGMIVMEDAPPGEERYPMSEMAEGEVLEGLQ